MHEHHSLNEGGIVTALKRYVFFDQSAVAEVRDALAEVRTEYDRQRLLRTVDVLLAEAKEMKKSGFIGDVVDSIIPSAVVGAAASAAGYYVGLRSKIPPVEAGAIRSAYEAAKNGVRSAFGAAKVDYRASRQVGAQQTFARGMASTAATKAIQVFTGIAAIVCILRVLNRNGDRIDDYVSTLTALRTEIAGMNIPESKPEMTTEQAVARLQEAKRARAFVGGTPFILEEAMAVARALCGVRGEVFSEAGAVDFLRARDVFTDAVDFLDEVAAEVFAPLPVVYTERPA